MYFYTLDSSFLMFNFWIRWIIFKRFVAKNLKLLLHFKFYKVKKFILNFTWINPKYHDLEFKFSKCGTDNPKLSASGFSVLLWKKASKTIISTKVLYIRRNSLLGAQYLQKIHNFLPWRYWREILQEFFKETKGHQLKNLNLLMILKAVL